MKPRVALRFQVRSSGTPLTISYYAYDLCPASRRTASRKLWHSIALAEDYGASDGAGGGVFSYRRVPRDYPYHAWYVNLGPASAPITHLRFQPSLSWLRSISRTRQNWRGSRIQRHVPPRLNSPVHTCGSGHGGSREHANAQASGPLSGIGRIGFRTDVSGKWN